MKFINLITILLSSLLSLSALAYGGGGGAHSVQFSIGLTTATQNDLNTWVDSLGAAGTKDFSSAYEFMVDYQYRYSGSMFALLLRPSMYSNSVSGGGVDMKLSGNTFFPMLRLYPLENGFMKFFMQFGVGIGNLSGTLAQGGASVDFKGSAFGAQGGLGAEFCFTAGSCLVLEGDYRYLPIDRNVITSYSGNLNNIPNGTELEFLNSDIATGLTGLQGVIGYHLYF